MLSAFLTGGIPAGLFFRTCNSLIGRHCPSALALPPHSMDSNSNKINKLVIVGVGLIGGSFSLALKQAGLVAHVTGVGRSQANLQRALQLGDRQRYRQRRTRCRSGIAGGTGRPDG